MTNLLQFDEQFNTQLNSIESAPWSTLRLAMLKGLHQFIVDNLPENQQLSYHLQINPLIVDAIKNIAEQPTIDPAILEWCYHQAMDDKNEGFKDEIALTIASSYFRLGAFNRLSLFLNRIYSLEIAIDVPTDSLHKQQEYFVEKLGEDITPHLYDRLHQVAFKRQFTSSHNTVNGLFVVQSGDSSIGVVAKLSYERAVASEKLALDQVRIATHLVDESDVLSEQTQSVCKYLHKKFNHKDETHVRLEFTLDLPSSLLVGSSAGLAFALLGQMGLHMYKSNRTYQPRVYSDIAFTGAIDENGNILPVAEKSLKYKIEAAFFGGIKAVIAPKSQGDLAKNELANIQQRYANGNLEILALANIEEIEDRKDIIHYQRRKVSLRVSQFVKDYANSVTYIIISFILLLGAGFWFGVVKNPIPNSFTYIDDGEYVVIRNVYNYKLWKSQGYVDSRAVLIQDIDENGSKEIIIGFKRTSNDMLASNVICYNNEGKEIWRIKTGKETVWGDHSYSDYFSVSRIISKDLNNNGKHEIIVLSQHESFPNQILILNNKGIIISEYWNAGHIYSIEAIDLYGDSLVTEVILSGTNNEYNSGIICVIDPFSIDGSSPQEIFTYKKYSNEILYLRFPLTHFVNKGYRDLCQINNININKNILRIDLVGMDDDGSNRKEIGSVLYTFTKNLELINVTISDGYKIYYQELFDNELTITSLDLYFSKLQYWSGTNWELVR